MDAGGELDTASGSITVRNVQGEVSTHSVSGRTALTQVYGSVDAQALSANVDLDTIGRGKDDRLVASTNHGNIAARRVRARDVELTTVDGKILLDGEAALHGRIVVASLHGDVDVRLRHHGPVIVRAHGTKVDLGVPARPEADGQWVSATFGTPRAGEDALVELKSQVTVHFALID
jgi:DUF4097 and DUF4098 domain-containing protein YvlB